MLFIFVAVSFVISLADLEAIASLEQLTLTSYQLIFSIKSI
jgi:hypothetical protein